MASRPTILVADDERDLADLYATWVDDDYDVLTAYDGRSALEQVDDGVDVVLLDRRMPDLSGDEVLATIRDRGHDCWVIMITAVDPGLDILELDVDDYVTKPVKRMQLVRLVENVRVRSRFDDTDRRELRALSNKMETLEDEVSFDELADSPEYRELEADLKDLGDSLVGSSDGDSTDGSDGESADERDEETASPGAVGADEFGELDDAWFEGAAE